MNQEARNKFTMFKQEANPGNETPAKQKNYNAEEFKKFLLACIFEKRLPKNEVLVMNLVQNIQTLK